MNLVSGTLQASDGGADISRAGEFIPDVSYAVNGNGSKFGSGRHNQDTFIAGTILSHSRRHGHAMGTQQAAEANQLIAHTLRADGFDASEDGTGRGTPLVFDERNITSKGNRSVVEYGRESHTLHESPPTVAGVFTIQERMESLNPDCGPNGKGWSDEGVAFTLESRTKPQSIAATFGVRRITPRECERLQGFPDDWTRWDADGNELSDSARYRMMGNAVSVPVIQWIGRRIVEAAQATD